MSRNNCIGTLLGEVVLPTNTHLEGKLTFPLHRCTMGKVTHNRVTKAVRDGVLTVANGRAFEISSVVARMFNLPLIAFSDRGGFCYVLNCTTKQNEEFYAAMSINAAAQGKQCSRSYWNHEYNCGRYFYTANNSMLLDLFHEKIQAFTDRERTVVRERLGKAIAGGCIITATYPQGEVTVEKYFGDEE